MNLTKIQYFAAWGYEDWVDCWTDDIVVLIKNQKDVGHDGIVHNTNQHSSDNAYFYMTDILGHTTFYRMNQDKFDEYWWNRSKVKK